MDLTYPVIVAAAKTWFRLSAMDIHMSGTEHIPTSGGALVAVNHVSYVDYLMGGYPGAQRGRYTRFMAKKEIFANPVGGPFMRSFGHLEVDREAGAASMRTAVDALRKGELVGIFPEATISQSFLIKDLKSGAVRIAADADVPLIPIVVWGTQRILAKGRKLDLSRSSTAARRPPSRRPRRRTRRSGGCARRGRPPSGRTDSPGRPASRRHHGDRVIHRSARAG
ncbi:1-acyl-sn-glycerol-3-phosphate acyltransferase [Nocardioides sp. REDSEA-S30_B4]|uniref:lysophospholipid acyltransferase family protein n=1 Tax=Nocardioides sp. REDSEA-S30_B4 TaxID=1811552 RepID=UPI0025E3260E|nr:lysophospholipid acyltransferase family protein [Nocardioides sp. REDSEA-S30_B4]